MGQIEEVIDRANLREDFHVFSGQCLSIAIALRDHFGGRVLLVSEIPGEGFDHAVLEKDGLLYDGSGNVGWTETVTRFVQPEARAEEPEPHYRSIKNPEDEFYMAFDKSVYNEVKTRLESHS